MFLSIFVIVRLPSICHPRSFCRYTKCKKRALRLRWIWRLIWKTNENIWESLWLEYYQTVSHLLYIHIFHMANLLNRINYLNPPLKMSFNYKCVKYLIRVVICVILKQFLPSQWFFWIKKYDNTSLCMLIEFRRVCLSEVS